MDQQNIEQSRAAANQGISAIKDGRNDEASQLFNSALGYADDIVNDRARRDELSALAALFDMCGFPDLGVMAAQEAVDLDRTLALDSLTAQDLLEVGNAQMALGNKIEAGKCFREALDTFLRREEYANAASANTNLSGIFADDGDMLKARAMLKTSLEYLKKAPFDNTEMQTRLGLLQIMEFTNDDLEESMANARELCSRFFRSMDPQRKDATRQFVARLGKRYKAAHPKTSTTTWMAKNFPALSRKARS